MKTRMHRKVNIHFSKFQRVGLLFLIIFVLGVFLCFRFNKKITPNLLSVAEASINKLNETILTNYRVKDIYKEVDLTEAISIVKNSKEEIITVDFNLERVYEALAVITGYLQRSLEDEGIRNTILKYYNEDLSSSLDSIVLSLPIGVASKGIYFANLGPRIPVKVSYMGYVSSSVRTKIEDYGINNALVSIYIDLFITNEFLLPLKQEEIHHDYSILIASKIVQGIVPEYYGGAIEAKSNILNVPIN